MRASIGLIFLAVTAVVCAADAPTQKNPVDHWTRSSLDAMEQPLHAKISGPRKNITMTLAEYGASGAAIGHREANGPGESHAANDDYFIVRTGEATLVTGGKIVNARETALGEIRGDGIEGGDQRRLAPGDVVHISAGVPHQMQVEPGKAITYFIVRTQSTAH